MQPHVLWSHALTAKLHSYRIQQKQFDHNGDASPLIHETLSCDKYRCVLHVETSFSGRPEVCYMWRPASLIDQRCYMWKPASLIDQRCYMWKPASLVDQRCVLQCTAALCMRVCRTRQLTFQLGGESSHCASQATASRTPLL